MESSEFPYMKRQRTPISRATVLQLAIVTFLCATAASSGIEIGSESLLPEDPRQQYSRYVRFRPGDDQVVSINPPRMSWPYLPEIVFEQGAVPATQLFTLQIADNPRFENPAFEVRDTPYNFFNFLPPLRGADIWYWRVGYKSGDAPLNWSDTRKFTLSQDADEWDRGDFGELLDRIHDHPRILFNRGNRQAMIELQEKDEFSRAYAMEIIHKADAALASREYRNFPANDDRKINYMPLSEALVHMGFAFILTGDEKYNGFRERALKMASWPPGGKSSPEGKGQSLKWQTHITEHLGMLYDWFYDEWTPQERAALKNSIEWRLDWTLNDFAWKQEAGKLVKSGSIAASAGSHPYQNIMAILPGALAICDESAIAREVLECGLHYLVGITNGHGEDEAWHDGPGYGNGKMKWLTNASWCLQSAVPGLQLGKNPAYSDYMDFFARITPIGAEHSSFGNRGVNELDWASSRIMNSIRVAFLRSDRTAIKNWLDTRARMKDLGKTGVFSDSPYIDYVMPLYAAIPQPESERDTVGLFASEGWITVSSAPPSDYEKQKHAVSMSFACRPRGGFSHSFRNENAFDIHACGETIAAGGGSTSNQSNFANDSMSHNTVLVNGREQAASGGRNYPFCGRIKAFSRGNHYVYWAGDATAAYGKESGLEDFTRHVLFVDDAYFVVFDELQMREGQAPATFQWLYHVPAPDSLEFADNETVHYRVGGTRVILKHIAEPGYIQSEHYSKGEGMVNRITGKDYRIPSEDQLDEVARKVSFGNSSAALPPAADVEHLWFSNRQPAARVTFLAVITPYLENDTEPSIKRHGNAGVEIRFRGKTTRISFDRDIQADITIRTDQI